MRKKKSTEMDVSVSSHKSYIDGTEHTRCVLEALFLV